MDNAKPRIETARGPLTAVESKALIDKLEIEADGSEILQRHLAIEEAIEDLREGLWALDRQHVRHPGIS
ncbi:MAG: hypothetical protein HC794_05940 [Nitrospiraceae bacterium]|nr:hypothetical protein [Nitrospiraceae bacterium]